MISKTLEIKLTVCIQMALTVSLSVAFSILIHSLTVRLLLTCTVVNTTIVVEFQDLTIYMV